jgi:hypothetical protein
MLYIGWNVDYFALTLVRGLFSYNNACSLFDIDNWANDTVQALNVFLNTQKDAFHDQSTVSRR